MGMATLFGLGKKTDDHVKMETGIPEVDQPVPGVAVKESDLYETPPEVFEYASDKYGPFDLDVCCEASTNKAGMYYTAQDQQSSLDRSWSPVSQTKAWMNPPYSNPKPWVEKALLEAKQNKVCTVALLPADTSTKWFHLMLHNKNVHIEYLPKRVRFLHRGKRSGSPKFGNVLVVFFPEIEFP